jgi:hypothetical protein
MLCSPVWRVARVDVLIFLKNSSQEDDRELHIFIFIQAITHNGNGDVATADSSSLCVGIY